MTPRQARAARAILALSMKEVCTQAGVGKRTLTEFESGNRAVYPATVNKLKAYYLSQGLSFSRPEDGEAVKFGNVPGRDYSAGAAVKEKREYLDLLNAEQISEDILAALDIHEKINEIPSISRAIMQEALKRSRLSQAEFSNRIGCTASFISSILVGKKPLPIKYASYLQRYFSDREIDVEKSLNQEKTCRKLASQIVELHKVYLEAWRSLNV